MFAGENRSNVPTYHIIWKFLSWEVFDVLVVCVDDLGELATVHLFLKHPHADLIVKVFQARHVVSNHLGNG